jgi:hypothetical protein
MVNFDTLRIDGNQVRTVKGPASKPMHVSSKGIPSEDVILGGTCLCLG